MLNPNLTMFSCDICSYTTSRKYNLQLHQNRKKQCVPEVKPERTVEDEVNVGKVCAKCSKCFKSKQSLVRHMKTCLGLNPLQCQTCYKIFDTSRAKCIHNRKVNCKRPMDAPETLQEENNRLKKENEILKDNDTEMKKDIQINTNKLKDKDEEIENLITSFFEEDSKLPQKSIKLKPKRSFVTHITKAQIAASQKWCCRICTTLFTGIYHMDHTIPLSFGGEDNRENVTALCVQCHAEKSQNEWKLRADMKYLTVEPVQT